MLHIWKGSHRAGQRCDNFSNKQKTKYATDWDIRLSESPWFHNDFQKTNKKNLSLLKIATSPNTDSENWEIKGKELSLYFDLPDPTVCKDN